MRGDPDDLLLLAGGGFETTDRVVYVKATDTTRFLTAPSSVPSTSTANDGVLSVVSTDNTPNSLTVKLPAVMTADQSYALWVRNAAGEWSNGVLINDARPLWLTPAYMPATGTVANLPRQLKVVGRNLQHAAGQSVEVKLRGPATYILTANTSSHVNTAYDHYVAVVDLPATMVAGDYEVGIRRDGASWVDLSDEFTVKSVPTAKQTFSVADEGCVPNTDADSTTCILNAISQAATNPGGGIVLLPAGIWRIQNDATSGTEFDGIVVPPGVDLMGAGAGVTKILRGPSWNKTAFTLQGNNRVEGITFKEERIYTSSTTPAGGMLQLGKVWYMPGSLHEVADVIITSNEFDKPYIALTSGGLPIKRLFITGNTVGAYATGLYPSGDPNNTLYSFRIDDSVIANNKFMPGSWMGPNHWEGPSASQLGASTRVDFSNNVADGSSIQYLNAPTDHKGWRAAFFWHMTGNHEQMLVSHNVATCTGDKQGDGEAIVYDNNQNTHAFAAARPALAVSPNTIKVAGPLRVPVVIPITGVPSPDVATYYRNHWIQVAEGTGLGQVRRILDYSIDPDTGDVTFTVAPTWEVMPAVTGTTQSKVTVAREFWQVYTVENYVDHRKVARVARARRATRRAGKAAS